MHKVTVRVHPYLVPLFDVGAWIVPCLAAVLLLSSCEHSPSPNAPAAPVVPPINIEAPVVLWSDCSHPIAGTLAGATLEPGAYCLSSEAKTGVLTLSGPADGQWSFRLSPGALTGTSFNVVLAGGARACNVAWRADAAVTMTDSHLKGRVFVGADATFTRGTFVGNVYAEHVTITETLMTSCNQ